MPASQLFISLIARLEEGTSKNGALSKAPRNTPPPKSQPPPKKKSPPPQKKKNNKKQGQPPTAPGNRSKQRVTSTKPAPETLAKLLCCPLAIFSRQRRRPKEPAEARARRRFTLSTDGNTFSSVQTKFLLFPLAHNLFLFCCRRF